MYKPFIPHPQDVIRAELRGSRAYAVHKKLSKTARALIGADIRARRGGTLKQVAEFAGISVSYLIAAGRLTPEEREAVELGERPLVMRPVELPQLRLSKIVDEIGLDRVLNLLHSFEMTRAA